MFIWNNIKNFMIKTPLVFTLFALVVFATDISLLYTYNFYYQFIDMRNAYDDDGRSYTISPQAPTAVSSALQAFCSQNRTSLKRVYIQLPQHPDELVINYLGGSSKDIPVIFGSYLSDKAKDEIVVPPSSPYAIGDTYIWNDQAFRVVGINAEKRFEISYREDLDLPALINITFVTERYLDNMEKTRFVKTIQSFFQCEVTVPTADPDQNAKIWMDFLFLFFLLVLSLINVIYVYTFVLQKRRDQCRIFRWLGCKRMTCVWIYLAELLCLTAALYLVSVLFFETLLLPIMHRIDDFYRSALTWRSYAGIFGLMSGLTVLMSIAGLWKSIDA